MGAAEWLGLGSVLVAAVGVLVTWVIPRLRLELEERRLRAERRQSVAAKEDELFEKLRETLERARLSALDHTRLGGEESRHELEKRVRAVQVLAREAPARVRDAVLYAANELLRAKDVIGRDAPGLGPIDEIDTALTPVYDLMRQHRVEREEDDEES